MNIIEAAVRLFAPHTCLGCGAEDDRLVCAGCAALTLPVPSRCYRCRAVTDNYAVCGACAPHTPLRQVLVRTLYRGTARELIRYVKYERARAGIDEAAALMAKLLPCVPADAVLVPVPTATARVRRRGYDHARLLARSLARRSGLEYAALLARVGQAHQVGSGRAERIQQIQGAFRPVHGASVRGRHVVLIDDVLTTGATLETAARALRQAGATRVSALVFAQA